MAIHFVFFAWSVVGCIAIPLAAGIARRIAARQSTA